LRCGETRDTLKDREDDPSSICTCTTRQGYSNINNNPWDVESKVSYLT
jgi:hypothetical protein